MKKGLKIVLIIITVLLTCAICFACGYWASRSLNKNNSSESNKDSNVMLVCEHSWPKLSETSMEWLKENLTDEIFCAHEIAFEALENKFPIDPYYSITMSIECGFNDGSTDTANIKINIPISQDASESSIPTDVDQTINLAINCQNSEKINITYDFLERYPDKLVDSVLLYFVGTYKNNDSIISLTENKISMSHLSETGEPVVDNEYKIVRAIDKGFVGNSMARYRRVLVLTHDNYGREKYFTLFAQSDTLSSHKIYVGETESATASPMYVAFEQVV